MTLVTLRQDINDITALYCIRQTVHKKKYNIKCENGVLVESQSYTVSSDSLASYSILMFSSHLPAGTL